MYGSHARGQSQKDLDWDIIILLGQPKVNRLEEKEYRDELFDIGLGIEDPISTFIFSKNDWEQKYHVIPLYQNIKREEVYL